MISVLGYSNIVAENDDSIQDHLPVSAIGSSVRIAKKDAFDAGLKSCVETEL